MATLTKINPFDVFATFNVAALNYFITNSPIPPAYAPTDIPEWVAGYYDTIISNAANFATFNHGQTYGIASAAMNSFYDNDFEELDDYSPVIKELFEYNSEDATELLNFLSNKERFVYSNDCIDIDDAELILFSTAVCKAALHYWLTNIGSWATFSVTASPARLAVTSMRATLLYPTEPFLTRLIAASAQGIFDALENN
jgi:hypothetical protein